MEVLVAVGLSSVIMMALFGVFNAVADVASGVIEHEKTSYGERAFEVILFDDLRSLYAKRGATYSFKGVNGSFLGLDGNLMEFCTSASLNNNTNGPTFSVQRVEYRLDEGEDGGKVLCRREKSHCGLAGNWEWVESPILRGIDEIEIEYLNGLDDTFITEWGAERGFPKAVKIKVILQGGYENVFLINLSLMAEDG